MPVPTPRSGESENDFISRCVSALHKDDPDRPNDQVVAMCYSAWRESKKAASPTAPPPPGEGRYRVVPMAIRAVENRPGLYQAYGALWGDEENPDLYGTFFNRDTNFHLDWFNKRPWLHHHGMNRFSGSAKVGEWKDADLDDYGLFFLGELDERFRYLKEIEFLMELGYLFPSSGTLSYLAKVADDGWVEEWPIVEVSTTVAPAEFRIPPVESALRSRAAQAIYTIQGGTSMSEDVEVRTATVVGMDSDPDAVGPSTVEAAAPAPEAVPEAPVPAPAPLDDLDLRALLESIDAAIREVHTRLEAVEGNVSGLMQPPADQVRELVSAGDWAARLFSVTRDGRTLNEPPEDSELPTSGQLLQRLGSVPSGAEGELPGGSVLGAIVASQH